LNWGAGTTPNGFTAAIYSNSNGTTVIQSYDSNNGGVTSINKTGLTASTQYWHKVSPKEADLTVTANCSIQTFTTTA
jgi:hypothetical protein